MPLNTTNPAPATHYQLILSGSTFAIFTECRDLGTKTQVVEERTIGLNGQEIVRKAPGLMTVYNIVLTRQATNDLSLLQWRRFVEVGDMKGGRKSGEIVGLDDMGSTVVRWTFTMGWPSKLVTNPLMATEELTLVVDTLVRVS